LPIKFCPHCNTRYVVGFDTTDYVHECNSGNAALDQEDVVVIGDWEDFSGSGTKPAQEVLVQGAENKLQWRRTGELGYDLNDLTRRGANAPTHRQRQHLQFIEIQK